MNRNRFNVLFLVKKSRVAKNGESPVFMRLTVRGERIETTLNLSVVPKKWNSVAEKVTGKDHNCLEVNNRLNTIRMRIMEIYRKYEFEGKEVKAREIMDEYLGRNTKPEITVLAIFKEHNER